MCRPAKRRTRTACSAASPALASGAPQILHVVKRLVSSVPFRILTLVILLQDLQVLRRSLVPIVRGEVIFLRDKVGMRPVSIAADNQPQYYIEMFLR
jgi:hypothetical protein